MDNVEMAADPSAARASKRLRKRPNYYMPSGRSENSLESDVNFRAVVTDNKNFKEFQDNISFKGVSSWRLSVLLRKLERELKLNRRPNYVWAVWSLEKQSKNYSEWERLTSSLQIKNLETTKLRCYRSPKPKKQKPKEPAPREPVRQVPQQPDVRAYMQQMAIMAAQDMTLAYWSMFYSPWCYMPPFQ